MTRKTEPLTETDWAWFDRNKFKYLNEAKIDYFAGEFAALLERAHEDISALTKEVEEAKRRVLEAIDGEDLFDATGTPEDEAYSQGVQDSLRAARNAFDQPARLSRADGDKGSEGDIILAVPID